MYDYIEHRERGERDAPGRAPPPLEIAGGVSWRRVGTWLARGADDLLACRGRSLVFGLCYVAAGHAILRAHALDRPWVPVLVAAFLFLGPSLAVGTYELSRQRERGERFDLLLALFAWCRNPRGIGAHAAWLGVTLTLWLQSSWTVLDRVGFADGAGIERFASPLWWTAWVAFSALVFVTGVVAVPMLLDRPVSATRAVRASVACCARNPLAMSAWALAVSVTVGLSLWFAFWPLLIVGPWLGHATWHVYRDCLRAAPLPSPRAPGRDA